ncbi:protein of unknown function [Pararobbsia alpina]
MGTTRVAFAYASSGTLMARHGGADPEPITFHDRAARKVLYSARFASQPNKYRCLSSSREF